MNQKIISSANKKILFLPHAIKQMSHPDRMITADEIRDTVQFGEIIEEYPEDQRGESCLVFHAKENCIIHACLFAKNRIFGYYYSILASTRSMVVRL